MSFAVETQEVGPSTRPLVTYSLVVPIFKNEANIPALLAEVAKLAANLGQFELVAVVDGSPDRSAAILADSLKDVPYHWQLVELSRNFGAFAAIRQGLALAQGSYIAVMAADLQEPPELVHQFFTALSADECDLAVGVRRAREDAPMTAFTSRLYWSIYRKTVMRTIPAGGVDVFACNRRFATALLQLQESNSFLIGQLFWVGFRRKAFPYDRRARELGRSAWNFRKRIKYMLDSIFAFSDLPIMLLLWIGALGAFVSVFASIGVVVSWMMGFIDVRGYAPIMLAIMFFGSLMVLGQGLLGCYIWRVAENTKKRPLSIIATYRTS